METKSVSEQALLVHFRKKHLYHIPLTEQDFLSLSRLFNSRPYPRKTFLLREGNRWNKVFLIRKGLIRLYYRDNEGREFNKAFFWEGHCIWPVGPADRNAEALFSIDALEAVTVMECSFQALHTWMREKNCWEKFALPFAETLVQQKFIRERDFLLHSATERFKAFFQKHPDIVRRLTDYHLASYLGITNVSLSRIKKTISFNKC